MREMHKMVVRGVSAKLYLFTNSDEKRSFVSDNIQIGLGHYPVLPNNFRALVFPFTIFDEN